MWGVIPHLECAESHTALCGVSNTVCTLMLGGVPQSAGGCPMSVYSDVSVTYPT